MYASMSRLRVPAERAEALVRAFRARVGLVDHADGFVDLQVGGMSGRRTAPPGGWPPPDRARLAGGEIALLPLATTVAERYFERYPEDLERYGDVARQWEIHDTQHLLNWAIGDVEGHVELEKQVGWLAGVLEARDFPLEHLAGNLELAADTVEAELEDAGALAGRLRDAAAHVRGASGPRVGRPGGSDSLPAA